jgi:ABC-type lipoprotein export system ATPase subunit
VTVAALIELDGISKRYNVGLPNEAEVLHGVSFTLARGEFAALIGPSGSGKSTLLNIIGLLERATAGSYRIQGERDAGPGRRRADAAAAPPRWASCSSSTTCCRPSPRWRT